MMNLTEAQAAWLDTYRLGVSCHQPPRDGEPPAPYEACIMEVVSFLSDGEWTDTPECVSIGLTSMMVCVNDSWDPGSRQRLLPLVPRLPGTACDGLESRRSWIALDWIVRTLIPHLLERTEARGTAQQMRDWPRVDSRERVLAANEFLGKLIESVVRPLLARHPEGDLGQGIRLVSRRFLFHAGGITLAMRYMEYPGLGLVTETILGLVRLAMHDRVAGGASLTAAFEAVTQPMPDLVLPLLDRLIDGRWDAA